MQKNKTPQATTPSLLQPLIILGLFLALCAANLYFEEMPLYYSVILFPFLMGSLTVLAVRVLAGFMKRSRPARWGWLVFHLLSVWFLGNLLFWGAIFAGADLDWVFWGMHSNFYTMLQEMVASASDSLKYQAYLEAVANPFIVWLAALLTNLAIGGKNSKK